MSQNGNDTDQIIVNLQALTAFGKNYDELNPIITERKASQLALDDTWIQKIWRWADSFDINDEAIPRDKKALLALKSIVLEAQGFTELPESIGQLSYIDTLELNYNQLKALPESIVQLQNLLQLGLNGNSLKALPESIGQLSNLTQLGLTGNNLKELPESIGHLRT